MFRGQTKGGEESDLGHLGRNKWGAEIEGGGDKERLAACK